MGDVIKATAVNYIKFVKESYEQYLKTGKKQRHEKAIRRLNKFLQQQPIMKEFVNEKLKGLIIRKKK